LYSKIKQKKYPKQYFVYFLKIIIKQFIGLILLYANRKQTMYRWSLIRKINAEVCDARKAK